MLLNILDNAVKYGRSGRRVELSAAAEGEYVRISVRDHGPGVAPEDLPHVKERFYKGRGKERGSGIGLAVCDEIVALHGGRLTVGERRRRRRAGDGGGCPSRFNNKQKRSIMAKKTKMRSASALR